MRDMLYPLGEEEEGESSQYRRWDAGAVPQLAAVAQPPKTKAAEEDASAPFLKHACPKGSQLFLKCPCSSSLWGKEVNESVPDGKIYRLDSEPSTAKCT